MTTIAGSPDMSGEPLDWLLARRNSDCSINPVLTRPAVVLDRSANSERQTSTSKLHFRALKAPVCNTGRNPCVRFGQLW
jgi:hypothetical protein